MQGIHESLERERLDAILAAKDLKYQTSVINRLKMQIPLQKLTGL